MNLAQYSGTGVVKRSFRKDEAFTSSAAEVLEQQDMVQPLSPVIKAKTLPHTMPHKAKTKSKKSPKGKSQTRPNSPSKVLQKSTVFSFSSVPDKL